MNHLGKTIYKILLCTLLVGITTSYLNAASNFWKWTRPFASPTQNISTLIITGNYAESRLLAELIQNNDGQPILLLPVANQEEKIFFLPPQKRSAALEVPYSELTNFINFINAKQILVLGGEKYISEKYMSKVSGKQVVWHLTGDNWTNIAASAGRLLNLTNLSSDYNKLFNQLLNDKNYYRGASETEKGVTPPVKIEPVSVGISTEPQHITAKKVIDASEK